jgi:hypothetical protein
MACGAGVPGAVRLANNMDRKFHRGDSPQAVEKGATDRGQAKVPRSLRYFR